MEKANANSVTGASIQRGARHDENAEAHGRYFVQCRDANGNLKWEDHIENVVCTEGKNAALTHFLKGSAYTASQVMGLIGNVSYTAPDAADVAGSIATSASPNGWNESTASVAAARQVPSFGTASSGSLSLASNVTFSIIGTDTINGVFVLCRSAAGVAPTTAVANQSGAIWSAGAFTGGAKAVSNGDTLSITYSTSL